VFIPVPVTRVSTEEHSTAKLVCAVKRPDVNVDWYRGDQVLFASQQDENYKYKRIDDGLQRELIVKNVSNDDQGDYVCQADKYRVTLHLNVQGEFDATTVRVFDVFVFQVLPLNSFGHWKISK
jgi:hypothetical protein